MTKLDVYNMISQQEKNGEHLKIKLYWLIKSPRMDDKLNIVDIDSYNRTQAKFNLSYLEHLVKVGWIYRPEIRHFLKTSRFSRFSYNAL